MGGAPGLTAGTMAKRFQGIELAEWYKVVETALVDLAAAHDSVAQSRRSRALAVNVELTSILGRLAQLEDAVNQYVKRLGGDQGRIVKGVGTLRDRVEALGKRLEGHIDRDHDYPGRSGVY